MKTVNLKLDSFEGPLDLLFHLIKKNEIDLYNIPIFDLTKQYLEYINTYPTKDMDSMSEFILMASTLLEIKSKMLLPKEIDLNNGEEIDPRMELVIKLIEYKRFKSMIEQFKNKKKDADLIFYSSPDKQALSELNYSPIVDIAEILDGLTIEKLFAAFEEVMNRKDLKIDKVRSGFNSVSRDLYTIEEKQEHILNLLKLYNKINFKKIFNDNSQKMEKIVTFLALLELIKIKVITIIQNFIFDTIYIIKSEFKTEEESLEVLKLLTDSEPLTDVESLIEIESST